MVDLSWKTVTFKEQMEFQSFKILQDFEKVAFLSFPSIHYTGWHVSPERLLKS